MKQTAAILFISFIFVALFLSVTVAQQTFAKSAKDSKARRDIDKAVGRAVEGAFSSIKTVNISTYAAPNVSLTVYNKTASGSLPPIRPPEPQPTPPPVVTPAEGYKVCVVGDLKGSTVPDAMKGCNYKIGLGDLGYQSDLSYFKGLGFDRCNLGNHESSSEDGNAAIEKETLAYCGDSWWVKFGTNTLMVGFNSNGDLAKQLNGAKNLIGQNSGIKNILLLSHKGGHVPPNAHHPAEVKNFYTELESIIPKSANLYEIFAHNHVMSASDSNHWYESGAGGKSHYACGQNNIWNFCNNKDFGYLQATIDSNDNIVINFLDTAGKILH